MARLTFFVGKGGVGKTTVSAAYAMQLAAEKPKESVLLLSTDPAHSLTDVFETKLRSEITRLRGANGKLSLWQLDAEKQFKKFFDPYREPVLQIIESGTLFSRAEIEPVIDSTLPGLAEISGLLALHELATSNEFDEIVVDTAPIGHTLRLFELPEHFSRFLHFLDVAGSRDEWLTARFGGKTSQNISRAFLSEWERLVAEVRTALSADHSRVVLVTSPETFSLNEALRTMEEMERSTELRVDEVVLNRVITGAPGSCPFCRSRARMTAAARKFLVEKFSGIQVRVGEYPGEPILGAKSLLFFGEHVFAAKKLRMVRAKAGARGAKSNALKLREAEWPELHTSLTFTLGKGGVGKTTVSASLAFNQRKLAKSAAEANKQAAPAMQVTVCSTDPAPSLDDIFEADVTGEVRSVLGDKLLRAIEVDSYAEYQRWTDKLRGKIRNAFSAESAGGVHLDMSFDREVFSALLDIVPPGVDEIFAIFRLMELLEAGNAAASHGATSQTGASHKVVSHNIARKMIRPKKEARGSALKRSGAVKRKSEGARDAGTAGGLVVHKLVIDMAPTGHALELLAMPERMLTWARLLLKSLAAHRTLPLAQDVAVEIASISHRVRELLKRMQDAMQSRSLAVMLAEPMPLRQTERLTAALEKLSIGAEAIFINRVIVSPTRCPRCSRARAAQMAVLAKVKRGKRPVYVLANQRQEIAGRERLEEFTQTESIWRLE